MKKTSRLHRHRIMAFTIVELLVSIAIIAMLMAIALPNFQYQILKAQSVRCASNLHGIGVAVLSAANDNNGLVPLIDQASTNVYQPPGRVPGLVGVLGRYGVTTNTVQCPVDMAMGAAGSFAQYQSSYEWDPVYDDGSFPLTTIAWDKIQIDIDSSRIRLCNDFVPIHNGKLNCLYADGHVTFK
jgi:prepilin-type processing-associated H-X9-DG protein